MATEPGALGAYLAGLLPAVLGAEEGSVPASFANELAEEPWDELAAAFVHDATQLVLFVDQHTHEGHASYAAARRPTYDPPHQVSSVALLKRHALLDTQAPLAPQMRVVSLVTPMASTDDAPASLLETPYEALETVVHNVMTPWFDVYAAHQRSHKEQREDEVPMVKRKFAELELGLRHLQQTIEIPQIQLAIHPVIRAAAEACAAEAKPVSSRAITPQSLLSDDTFINELHTEMNGWVRAVQKLTKLDRDASTGNAMQEIQFWTALEHALEDLERQLHAPEVTMTLDLLTQAKRFHATVSFHADTGIKDSLEKVRSYNVLLRDFPLDDLLAATTLAACQDAVRALFSVLLKKLRMSSYPVARALLFVEAVGREMTASVTRVLRTSAPMQLPYEACASVLHDALEVLAEWDEQVKEFVYVARDLTRKRAARFIPIKVHATHAPLRTRLEHLLRFRSAHKELVEMADAGRAWHTSAASPHGLLVELDAALNLVRAADTLDVSDKGTQLLAEAETQYDARIAHVEHQLINTLRGLLDGAQTAREQLRILAQCNRLFVRPKVRAAVQEYQQVLLQRVQSDIRALHAKFRRGFRGSEAHRAAQLRHQPEIVGAIVWANELERQLHMYLQRVQDVLGAGWKDYADGQRIHAESATFAAKLDTRPLLTAWSQETARRGTHVTGPLVRVVRERDTHALLCVAQYNAQAYAFAEEAHALSMLGMAIPQVLLSAALDARRIYPFALSVVHSLRTLDKVRTDARELGAFAPLLAHGFQEAHSLLAQALDARWERFLDNCASVYSGASAEALAEDAQVALVLALAAVARRLETQLADLGVMQAEAMHAFEAMRTCAYEHAAFAALLAPLQARIDELNLASYPNLDGLVETLHAKASAVLSQRLVDELERMGAMFAGRILHPDITLSLRFTEAALRLEPPMDEARAHWYRALRTLFAVVLELAPLHAARYALDVGRDEPVASEYSTLVAQIPAAVLTAPLARLEARLAEAAAYVRRWLQLQFLWHTEPESLVESLGEDLDAWQYIASCLRQTRALVDAPQVKRSFTLVEIDCAPAQARVASKLDAWEHDWLPLYAERLSKQMHEAYTSLATGRQALEPMYVGGASTSQAVALITLVQRLSRHARHLQPAMAQFAAGQATLERQHALPPSWLHAEQVAGEHAALLQLLSEKRGLMDSEHDSLHARIAAEDRAVAARIEALVASWAGEKPVGGAVPVKEALSVLDGYAERLAHVQGAVEQLGEAQEAFGMSVPVYDALPVLADELADLRSVWGALAAIWAQLDEVRATPWAAVQVRTVRQRLDELLRTARGVPSRMRQYAAYEHIQTELAFLLKHTSVLSDLRSDAFQERHWRALYKKLGQRYVPSAMTLGAVWDINWHENLGVLQTFLANARGEYALDVYLQQVRDAWSSMTLELVNYRNECMLVRGFDALFQLTSEHANGLRAMSASPYYHVFEEEAQRWEERLARVESTFDLWVDVQRRFVYLNGIFSATAEIRHILPMESSRFQSIHTEFLAILRRAQRTPVVLEVIQQPGLEAALERLAELLHKIQGALGAYLERERARYPRFYFVGDEDLLEMLGNSQDVDRVAQHFAKMFAGMRTVMHDGGLLTGVATRTGEVLVLDEPVALADHTGVHAWLGQLEQRVRSTLASSLRAAVSSLASLDEHAFLPWLESCPVQVAVLAMQIVFVRRVEATWAASAPLEQVGGPLADRVQQLAAVIPEASAHRRRACEQLLTLLTHQSEVLMQLEAAGCTSADAFPWQYQLRHYLDGDTTTVRMAHTSFVYGFELLDLDERLVYTPLTTACFTTLTQALHAQYGGAPFGPAGTGKTETVKALAHELGRLVLVFNCDSQFDVQAMARILAGLSRVGAWGCFDEFNRLEERVLSSVSQQIHAIQHGLRTGHQAEVGGTSVTVHAHTGIFVTMNPRYAGRSHLPDNLKQLFRSAAMSRPDERRIVQVLLLVHGFQHAAVLAPKIVLLFQLCSEQLSNAVHYDFGLRALKAVLRSAAASLRAQHTADRADSLTHEQAVVVQSVHAILLPKLTSADVPALETLVSGVFPGVHGNAESLETLQRHLVDVCAEQHLGGEAWRTKAVQLYHMLQVSHGVLLVGPAGSGKTMAWRVLLEAMQRTDRTESVAHVLEPKVWSNEHLYGTLDPTTREWTDGLFTALLRRIRANARRELEKRHWIVLDGDIDPEWVENLNSVLDDNRILTLPTGERLVLPDNVRILLEVDHVDYATPATISRCGMVAFGPELVPLSARLDKVLDALRTTSYEEDDEFLAVAQHDTTDSIPSWAAGALTQFSGPDALIAQVRAEAENHTHSMPLDDARFVSTLLSLLRRAVRRVFTYNARHIDFPLGQSLVQAYMGAALCAALVWASAGDASHKVRHAMSDFVRTHTEVDLPRGALVDYDLEPGRELHWTPWSKQVVPHEIETSVLATTGAVIPTLDTVRQEALLYAFLLDERPVVLCGPPGSGKTMVLYATLRHLADVTVAMLNLSSQTTPATLLTLLEEHCVYEKTASGTRLAPSQLGQRLVVFCDEINLPLPDTYGTQRVISFMRQLVEQRGFWRANRTWVTLERIQFVGACNPPTDPGRTPLTPRFLRHASVIMVDYPAPESLQQIYHTFARSLLRAAPNLQGYAEALTQAMVHVYLASQAHFTPDMQAHYIYSPRELTRWIRGMHRVLNGAELVTLPELARVWAYEGLRLFQDRLVHEEERVWTDHTMDEAARAAFPSLDVGTALARPILYSDWLSKDYRSVERAPLRAYTQARLRGYSEEVLESGPVLHDAVLDLALGCDRVLQQPAGHLLLIGVSGSGRTTVAQFCAWMRGLSLYSVPTARSYRDEDFDDDLRKLLRRVGAKGEKVCWTLDEGQVVHPARLEKLNTLLANAEVAGLFEGEEHTTLLSSLREAAQREGLLLTTEDELLSFFRTQILTNLHVVLTMNPPRGGVGAQATASPALFNRCTLVYCW